jgi:hypothetical protein
MKNYLTSIFCTAMIAVLSVFTAQFAQAQATTGPALGMTAGQAVAVKAIKIANLDKDTYLKTGGFILDRYEERPAYVFTYSDGITRKIYLYRIFDAASTKELGLAAYYVNGKTNDVKTFVMPGASGDRKAWDAYIDDLKYVGEKEPGLMSTLTFVLSREMASLLSGGAGKTEDGDKKKEEYNFCFAADAPVTMADGSSKAISEVQVGDLVKSYDAATRTIITTPVTRIDRHDKTGSSEAFALVGVWVVPTQEITVSTSSSATPVLLEATPNHPVLTATGRKTLGEVKAGELLYQYQAGLHTVTTCRVLRIEPAMRRVPVVYNLVTAAGSYFVNDAVVLDK